MNGVLDDAATAEAADTADNLWSTNGDLYTANGISKTSLQTYLLNAQKAKALLKMTYGPDGTTPVAEDEYTDFVNNDCYYIEAVQFRWWITPPTRWPMTTRRPPSWPPPKAAWLN